MWPVAWRQPGWFYTADSPHRAGHVLQTGSVEEHTACVQEVAALTNLQHLRLGLCVTDGRLAPAVLTPLTALKQLVYLYCWQVLPEGTNVLAVEVRCYIVRQAQKVTSALMICPAR